jgi:hypothetical protein
MGILGKRYNRLEAKLVELHYGAGMDEQKAENGLAS